MTPTRCTTRCSSRATRAGTSTSCRRATRARSACSAGSGRRSPSTCSPAASPSSGGCRVATRHSELIFEYFFADDADDVEAIVKFSEEVADEDVRVCEHVQRNLDAGNYHTGFLSPKWERGVGVFQQLVRDAVGRIDEAGHMTAWPDAPVRLRAEHRGVAARRRRTCRGAGDVGRRSRRGVGLGHAGRRRRGVADGRVAAQPGRHRAGPSARGGVVARGAPRPESTADVIGSAYCIRAYDVDSALRWARRTGRGAAPRWPHAGVRLLVDFVPNHVAPDHPWLVSHPDRFVQGTPDDVGRRSGGVRSRSVRPSSPAGRDPYFAAWPDVAQLNAFSPPLRAAVIATLDDDRRAGRRRPLRHGHAAGRRSVFARTWGERAGAAPPTEFWPDASRAIARRHPDFLFVAEVYWDLRVGPAAAGLRLHLRQAALRPAACTTAPARCAATCTPTSTSSDGCSGSWRTTTSRAPPR